MKTKLNNVLSILLSLFVLIAASSCGKDNNSDKNNGQSRTELLTQKPWVLVKQQTRLNNGDWIDFDTKLCTGDDIIKLNTDKTYYVKSGAVKCSPSQPDEDRSGTWSWANAEETVLNVNYLHMVVCKVEELTETTKKLNGTYTEENGTKVEYISEYKHP